MKFLTTFVLICAALPAQIGFPGCMAPGSATCTLLDAHNCYPYEGLHKDRIDRALAIGFPVAIEQDIGFYDGQAVVTHTDKTTGGEPTLKEHFFERVRPIIEKALKDNQRDRWPLIVLHFDFKDLQPATLHAVWDVLKEYEPWLATATKTADPDRLSPFDMKPILVLTEDADQQQVVFYDEVPLGGKMRIFGSAHTKGLTAPANNYRRWLNYSWHEVEAEGQPKAGAWTEEKNARLKELVDGAHKLGYWIRFYTLDGYTAEENQGWFASYNFVSRAAVEARWKAAMDAGVDMIASDQYETLAKFMQTAQAPVILKAETRAVQIDVAVKTKDGRPIRDLQQKDFVVRDNGKRREIQFFSADDEPVGVGPNGLPSGRVTAIVLDAVNTAFEDQSHARAQAMEAIGRMQLDEAIAVLTMTPDLILLQNFTRDRDRLVAAVNRFHPAPPVQVDSNGSPFQAKNSGQSRGPREDAAFAQYAMRRRIEATLASLKTLATRMADAPGRKSILWLTAGFPPNRDYNDVIQKALNRINDSNVAIYPIDARGLMVAASATINIATMQLFAASTGGEAYYNRNDLARAVEEAAEDSKFTYVVGFYLTDHDRDNGFHELKVKVNQPGAVLHYRRGYSPPAISRNLP